MIFVLSLSDLLHSQRAFLWAIVSQGALQVALVIKNPPANAEDVRNKVQSQGQEDPLEDSMATHFSILAWRIAWTEEPGGIQSLASQRVEHN